LAAGENDQRGQSEDGGQDLFQHFGFHEFCR
jgi:hypothetical protein